MASSSGFGVFIDGEFVATAVLRFDVASRTASAIRDVLPLEAPLMHVTCSGEGSSSPSTPGWRSTRCRVGRDPTG